MKQFWGVRHLRYAWHSFWFWRWWYIFGQHFWVAPNESDLNYLDRIWRGEQRGKREE